MVHETPIKLIVINSWGPMGSSTLAGLVEKWGYLNVPIRKTGLTDYLTGARGLDDPFIRERFRHQFNYSASERQRGGLGRAAKRVAPRVSLIDFELVSCALNELDQKQFSRIADLYDAYRALYARAITYKDVHWSRGCHIELTTDSTSFSGTEFARCYEEHFDEVKIFHMTRRFEEWIESFAVQFMGLPEGFTGFRLDQAMREYDLYLNQINRLPGHIVDLEDLMIPKFFETEKRLRKIVGRSALTDNFEKNQYDIWGRVVPFTVAFSLQDRGGSYLNFFTRLIIRLLRGGICSGKLRTFVFHPIYLLEALRYRLVAALRLRQQTKSGTSFRFYGN